MSNIFIHIEGNGYAWVTDDTPFDGQRIVLYVRPYDNEELLDITAYDSYDHSIAMRVAQEQSFTFDSSWNNMYINVYFSGETPPEPPEPPVSGLNWLIPVLAKKVRKRRKN